MLNNKESVLQITNSPGEESIAEQLKSAGFQNKVCMTVLSSGNILNCPVIHCVVFGVVSSVRVLATTHSMSLSLADDV